jgi:hypothetical protein
MVFGTVQRKLIGIALYKNLNLAIELQGHPSKKLHPQVYGLSLYKCVIVIYYDSISSKSTEVLLIILWGKHKTIVIRLPSKIKEGTGTNSSNIEAQAGQWWDIARFIDGIGTPFIEASPFKIFYSIKRDCMFFLIDLGVMILELVIP